MVWNYGPERAEAIRVLREQIQKARIRLEAIGATADAEETSFEARDAADLAYGELKDEIQVMEEVIEKLSNPQSQDDLMTMEDALKILLRDVEKK